MTTIRALTGLSVFVLVFILQSEQGAGATRDALSAVDDAVAKATPFVAEQAQMLQRLGRAARENIERGARLSIPQLESSPGNTTT